MSSRVWSSQRRSPPRGRTTCGHGWLARAAFGALAAVLVTACGGKEKAPASVRYAADGSAPGGGIAPRKRMDVLWVCLDTVRADAFAPWASGTPLLAETSAWLATRAVTFRNAAAPAPWTAPSIASLLTSLLPSQHGARELSPGWSLVTAIPTAAEILGAHGWNPGAYTGGGWVRSDNGMLQGFREVLTPFSFGFGATVLQKLHAELRGFSPWFLFVHTYEAHDPYGAPPARPGPKPPPADVDAAAIDREGAADGGRSLARRFLMDPATRDALFERADSGPRLTAVIRYFERGFAVDPQGPAFAAEARAAYDDGLRRLDRSLAAWLRGVEDAGGLKNAIVVVTSDHGEAFGEHGILHHGRRLHDELVHVPLFVAAPGWPAGRVVDEPCSLLDVLPTTLELVGLPPGEAFDGVSLVPLLHGGAGRPAFSEERKTSAETGHDDDATLVSVRDGARKWIRTVDHAARTATEEAFDLAADPRETRPLPAAALDSWPAPMRDAVRRARETR